LSLKSTEALGPRRQYEIPVFDRAALSSTLLRQAPETRP